MRGALRGSLGDIRKRGGRRRKGSRAECGRGNKQLNLRQANSVTGLCIKVAATKTLVWVVAAPKEGSGHGGGAELK